MKYPIDLRKEPIFNYIVKLDNCSDYYLFINEEDALKQAETLSARQQTAIVYELFFDPKNKFFFGESTFSAYDGTLHYLKNNKKELQIESCIHAGEWMNPNETWIRMLQQQYHQPEQKKRTYA